jgi:hypothetical protein
MDGFRHTPDFVPVAPSELAILFGGDPARPARPSLVL